MTHKMPAAPCKGCTVLLAVYSEQLALDTWLAWHTPDSPDGPVKVVQTSINPGGSSVAEGAAHVPLECTLN